jgi:hypothetical protein
MRLLALSIIVRRIVALELGPASQQLPIGRDSALRVAQARDQGVVVGSHEAEHDLECQAVHGVQRRDFSVPPATGIVRATSDDGVTARRTGCG